MTSPPDHVIVPQLYFVPESELSDEVGTSMGSMATIRDMTYQLEARRDPIPFLWAQSLFYTAKLLRERKQKCKKLEKQSDFFRDFSVL